jgi:hypothetical protein
LIFTRVVVLRLYCYCFGNTYKSHYKSHYSCRCKVIKWVIFLLLSLSYFLLYTTLVKPHPYHIASFVRFCEFNCHYANTGVLTYSNSITSAFCKIRFKKLIGFHCTLYTSKIIVFHQKLKQSESVPKIFDRLAYYELKSSQVLELEEATG